MGIFVLIIAVIVCYNSSIIHEFHDMDACSSVLVISYTAIGIVVICAIFHRLSKDQRQTTGSLKGKNKIKCESELSIESIVKSTMRHLQNENHDKTSTITNTELANAINLVDKELKHLEEENLDRDRYYHEIIEKLKTVIAGLENERIKKYNQNTCKNKSINLSALDEKEIQIESNEVKEYSKKFHEKLKQVEVLTKILADLKQNKSKRTLNYEHASQSCLNKMNTETHEYTNSHDHFFEKYSNDVNQIKQELDMLKRTIKQHSISSPQDHDRGKDETALSEYSNHIRLRIPNKMLCKCKKVEHCRITAKRSLHQSVKKKDDGKLVNIFYEALQCIKPEVDNTDVARNNPKTSIHSPNTTQELPITMEDVKTSKDPIRSSGPIDLGTFI